MIAGKSRIAAMAVGLSWAVWSGCSIRANQKAANTPPAPKPITPSAPEPIAPEGPRVTQAPISTPQTSITLPSPQPLGNERLPPRETQTMSAPATPPAQPAPPRVSRQASQPAVAPPSAQAKTPPRQRVRPLESAAERRRLQSGVTARQQKVRDLIAKIKGRQLSDAEKASLGRVEAFMEQADVALKNKDLQQAEALSNRALLLGRELEDER